MPVNESMLVNASPAPTLQDAYAELSSVMNSGQFETADAAFAKFDEAAHMSHDLSSDFANDELVERLKHVRSTDERQAVTDIYANAKYSKALLNLCQAKDYAQARALFRQVHELIEVVKTTEDASQGAKVLGWRAWYHVGLSSVFENNCAQALTDLQKLEENAQFQASLQKFLAREANENEGFSEITEVPSDVLTGVLYYIAHAYLMLSDYVSAWNYLRRAEQIGGNDTSKQVQREARTRLVDSYKDAITARYIGDPNFQIRKHDEVDVKLTSARQLAQKKVADVTAIIPVYNGDSKHFREAVASVAAQTILPSELIVIDDGSASSSVWILDEIELPFDLILVKTPNGGQSRARNIGATIARGRYVAYLDQDDIWNANHLEELAKPFETVFNLGWVYSNLDEVDLDGKMLNRGFLNLVARNRDFTQITNLIAHDMFILPSASLILRESLRTIGGFDESLSGYEDDDLFVRLFRHGYDHRYIADSLSRWRIHTASCSYQERMVHSRRKFYQKLCREFPDDPQMGRFWVRDIVAPRFFAEALHRYKLSLGAGNESMAALAREDINTILPRMQVSFKVRLWVQMMQKPKLFSLIKGLVDVATMR